MTESLYTRPRINPLLKWYLRGVLDVMKQTNCALPMGVIRYWDANDVKHELQIINGDWLEMRAAQ